MLRTVQLLLGLCVVAVGCDNGPTSPSDAIGETWTLISLQEAGSSTPVTVNDPSRYQVTFEDGGSLGVKSDCNTCGASYALSGSTLTIAPLTCTKVFCGETSLDSKFSAALEKAQSLTVDDDEMTIRGVAGTLRFTERD